MMMEREPVGPLDRAAVVPRRREGVIGHTVSDEMVLFSTSTETAVSLNLTAAAVWELCDGATSVARIIELLSEDVGDDSAGLAEDVERVLRDMEGLSLLDLTRSNAGDRAERDTPAEGRPAIPLRAGRQP